MVTKSSCRNGKKTTLELYLIKPSKYDDDGYIIRYRKGALPSNTLAVLYALTDAVAKSGELGPDLNIKIKILDEQVHNINTSGIINQAKGRRNTKTLICLCGVQTNQWARARDLALTFGQAGLSVMIGGFHVSGELAVFGQLTPELAELSAQGIILVAGEVEHEWQNILKDFLADQIKPLYNFLAHRPDLAEAPIPHMPRSYMKKFALSYYGTLDCGRGCPFGCSFCCIINVQGRKMRFRSPEKLMSAIRSNYYKNKIKNYFFTDDNFARNKNWEQIFDTLITLKEDEKIPLNFMMQIDTQAYKIENFIKKAKRAGCTQAFIGIESLNPQNLDSVGKVQNNIQLFKEMNDYLLQNNISTHAAYIIGFPQDTPESIRRDIQQLIDIGFCQASFFILTPMPGSQDHRKIVEQRHPLDVDYNNYDTFRHQVMKHPNLQHQELMALYQEAWTSFYGTDNIKKILMSTQPLRYYAVMGSMIWYKYAIDVEQIHPLLGGFLRLKSRSTRRPIFDKETFFTFFVKRWQERFRKFRRCLTLLREFEEVWLETRPRTKIESVIVDELKKLRAGIQSRIHLKELTEAIQRAGLKAVSFKWRYSLRKIFMPILLPVDQRLIYSRKFLNNFWHQTKLKIAQGKFFRVNFFKLIINSIYELQLAAHFGLSFLKSKKNRIKHELFSDQVFE